MTTIELYYPTPGLPFDSAAWVAVDPANRANTQILQADNGDGSYSTWMNITNNKPYYPCIKKFASPGTNFGTTTSVRNIFLARLAETYLIRAEAEINSGDAASAASDMNVVRARSKASPITASQATLDFLLDERAREFAGEYQRWYDLKRTGKLTTYVPMYNPDVPSVSYMQGNDGQYKTLRPIPQNAINLDKDITQNPGY